MSEAELLRWLDERGEETLRFAQELVSIPSVNPPGDERHMASHVSERLARLGIRDHAIHSEIPERPNLIAHVRGRAGGRRLILCGHLDTKPVGDRSKWQFDPMQARVRDGRLEGLGAGDMKAAVAGMVYAAGALGAVGFPHGELQLVLTADEEAGSTHGSRWLGEQGLLEADAAIVGEPGGIADEWEAIHLVSRGVAQFTIRVHGTQMHSSVSDRFEPINATVKMAELILRMEQELKERLRFPHDSLDGHGPSVSVGVIATAGVYYDVYPGHAEFACEIRTVPGMTRDGVISDVSGLLEDAMTDDPDLKAELDFETWVDAAEISRDAAIVQALLSVAPTALGFVPRLEAFPAAGDSPRLQGAAGVPSIAAFGPGMLPRSHSPNEWLDASGPQKAARVYALAALAYLSGSASTS